MTPRDAVVIGLYTGRVELIRHGAEAGGVELTPLEVKNLLLRIADAMEENEGLRLQLLTCRRGITYAAKAAANAAGVVESGCVDPDRLRQLILQTNHEARAAERKAHRNAAEIVEEETNGR